MSNDCIRYSYHVATEASDNCIYCGVSTADFNKNDWDSTCHVARERNIRLEHNYVLEHLYGMAIREQDYTQVAHYRCANCNHRYVERDDQR